MTTTRDVLREERRYVTRSRERIVELLRAEKCYLSASAIARSLGDRGRDVARFPDPLRMRRGLTPGDRALAFFGRCARCA